jgi:hypothetical protein
MFVKSDDWPLTYPDLRSSGILKDHLPVSMTVCIAQSPWFCTSSPILNHSSSLATSPLQSSDDIIRSSSRHISGRLTMLASSHVLHHRTCQISLFPFEPPQGTLTKVVRSKVDFRSSSGIRINASSMGPVSGDDTSRIDRPGIGGTGCDGITSDCRGLEVLIRNCQISLSQSTIEGHVQSLNC